MTRLSSAAWAPTAMIAAGVLLASCANRPDSIHASYVSHEKYMHFDCSELAGKMANTRTELERNSQIQNDKANMDAVGVFLFGVPFSKLSGDAEGEIARLKGEIEAIDTAQIKQECGSNPGPRIAAATESSPRASAPALAASPRDKTSPSTQLDERLPAAGTTWTYRYTDRIFGKGPTAINVRVLRSDSTSVEELVAASANAAPVARRMVNIGELRFLEYPMSANSDLVELAPYLLAGNDGKGMPRGLQATGYPQGTLGPWVASIEEKGWERITVPAGSFQALRVEIQGRRVVERQLLRADVEVGRFSIVAWYSPDVRRLVRLEHKTWSATHSNKAQIGHDVVELLSYRPPS